jgi:predicted methyltransferase
MKSQVRNSMSVSWATRLPAASHLLAAPHRLAAPYRLAAPLLLAALLLFAAAPPALADEPDEEIRLLSLWLALAPGKTVADIGAGDGEYAIALANYVLPNGVVYATELEQEQRDEIAEAAQAAGAKNIEVRAAQIESTGLPAGCCDAALVRDVYHHFTAPEKMAASLFETIRPGGRLVVVDFPPTRWLSFWTPKDTPDRGGHGIEAATLIKELEAVGFQVVDQLDEWPTSNFVTRNYGLSFYRP